MSREEMKKAIERAKQPKQPKPAQPPLPAAATQTKPAKPKKERPPFVKFHLPIGAAFTFQQREVGKWFGVLAGVNPDGTVFSFEMETDGVHRLARELGRMLRENHGAVTVRKSS